MRADDCELELELDERAGAGAEDGDAGPEAGSGCCVLFHMNPPKDSQRLSTAPAGEERRTYNLRWRESGSKQGNGAETRLVNLSGGAGKLAGGRGGAKKSGDFRTPGEVNDEEEQNEVRGGLFERVERADGNVQSKPGSENPTSPVVANEKKDSADDGEDAEQEDENGDDAKRLGAQFVQMVNEAEEPGGDEENGEDPDGDGAGLHFRAGL